MTSKKNRTQNLKVSPEHEKVSKDSGVQASSSTLARFKIDKFRDIWFLFVFMLNFLASLGLMIYLLCEIDCKLGSYHGLFWRTLSWCLFLASAVFFLIMIALLLKPVLVKYVIFVLPVISTAAIALAFFVYWDNQLWLFGLLYTCLIVIIGLLTLLFSNNTRLSEPFYVSVSNVFRAHPTSLMFLLACFISTFGYMLIWGFAFTFNFSKFGYTAFWYLLLSLYWTMESMRYFVHTVIAGIVARHYLQSEEEKSKQNITWAAAKVGLTYTAGSTTIGALLLTPVTVLRQCMWFFGFINDESYTDRCGSSFGGLFNKMTKTFHPYTLTWLSIYGDERSYVQSAHEAHDRVVTAAGLERVERKAFPDRTLFMVIFIIGLSCAGISIHQWADVGDIDIQLPSFRIHVKIDTLPQIFSGMLAGLVLIGVMLEAIRGAIYSTLVCCAEDQKAVQTADSDIADHIDKVATRQELIPQSPSAIALNKELEAEAV